MYGKTRNERIRNEYIREHLGIASIGEKLRETRLKSFGHVKHRPTMV